MAFSFVHGILCDTPKKSRGKNVIIVRLHKVKRYSKTTKCFEFLTWIAKRRKTWKT